MRSLSSRRRWRCLLLLETCKSLKQLHRSHSLLITSGLHRSPFALSRLLSLYSSLDRSSLLTLWALFARIDRPPTPCIYNTVLHALLLHDRPAAALHVYSRMLSVPDTVRPDGYTLPCILKACTRLSPHSLGETVHGHAIKLGLFRNLFVGNALLAFYFTLCGQTPAATKVFDEMPDRDEVSWTLAISGSAKAGDVDAARVLFDEAPVKDLGVWGAMISGYVQNNCFKEGLHLFRLMQLEVPHIEPDEALLVSVLSACAHLGTLETGVWVHRFVELRQFRPVTRLWTGLIDMYAKCGCLSLAKLLFDEMPQRDTVCWNALIMGFSMNGDGRAALELFHEMEKDGILPDSVTYISIMSACSHSGMAHEGLSILQKLLRDYKIELKNEHYGCLVELFGRAGLLHEAMEILVLQDSRKSKDGSSSEEDPVAWRALLNACCKHGDVKLAELVAERLMRIERDSGAYVLLSNLYAVRGKQEEAQRVRMKMREGGFNKAAPGCSSIQIGGISSEFVAGEKTHPQMDEICFLLEKLNQQSDYRH